MGGNLPQVPYLHQARKAAVGQYGRILHARSGTVRPFRAADVGRAAAQGRVADDRALHGVALRSRLREEFAGACAERSEKFFQLSAAHRCDREFALGVHRDAQVQPPAARRAVDRRDRPDSRRNRPHDAQGRARRRDARTALFVRTACLGVDLAEAVRSLLRRRIHPSDRQGRQAAVGSGERHGPRKDLRLSRLPQRRQFERGDALPEQSRRTAFTRDDLHDHQAGRTARGYRQAGQPPHLPPLVRHASARRRRFDPAGAGDAGARKHHHDRNLHAPRQRAPARNRRHLPI